MMPGMSYALAVWEGQKPESNESAAQMFEELMDRWQEGADGVPPTPNIAAYVEALLDRWPDITTEEGESSPWADGPLINNAMGPIVYFSLIWSMAEEASTFAADLAASQGLACFDPQAEVLRP